MFLLVFFLLAPIAVSAAKKQDFCFNGETMENLKGNGETFWKCVNNRWTLEWCIPGYRYSPSVNGCVFHSVTNPPTRPPIGSTLCRPGNRMEYLFDNTKFQECDRNGRKWIIMSCHHGKVFNPTRQECIAIGNPTTTRPYTTTRRHTTTTTPEYGPCKESGGAAGYKPDYYNCKNFYQCASGLWTQRSCGEGTIWNQALLTCDHNRGQCSPRPRPTVGPPAPPPIYYPPNNNNGGSSPIEVEV